MGTARVKEGDPHTGAWEARAGRALQLPQRSRGEDARCRRPGGRGSCVLLPRLQGERMGRQEGGRPGTPAARGEPAREGCARGCKGSGSATHLSELESRDDGDHDAHEADVEPIPVGQAGIGLSLQELEQHHPGPATPRREEPAPRRTAPRHRLSEPPSTAAPPRSAHSPRSPCRALSLRRPTARWAPRRGRRFREPGAHALGAAEADPAARKAAGAARLGLQEAARGSPAPPGGRRGKRRRAPSPLRVRCGLCPLDSANPAGPTQLNR